MQELIRARTRRHCLKLGAATTAKAALVLSAGSALVASVRNPAFSRERYGQGAFAMGELYKDKDKDKGKDFDRDDHKVRDFDERDQREQSCFLKGTRIATPRGDVPVEELNIGNEVYTRNGTSTIKWIGYNKFQRSPKRAWSTNVMPIRVAQRAIDDLTPRRDLYLSATHCLFLDGFLIPVSCLINETSIVPHVPSDADTIEYYHVEFDGHEIIYAEKAAVESYLGTNRENFLNFVQYERLYGVECRPDMLPCAPILGYHGGRDELRGLAKSLISNVIDIRDPIQIISDRIAERAGAVLI